MSARKRGAVFAASFSFLCATAGSAQDMSLTEQTLRGTHRVSVSLALNPQARLVVGTDTLALRKRIESALARAGLAIAELKADTDATIVMIQVRYARDARTKLNGLNADCQALQWMRAPSHPPVSLWAAAGESETMTGIIGDATARGTVTEAVDALTNRFIAAWRSN